jgi:hypothetical protein
MLRRGAKDGSVPWFNGASGSGWYSKIKNGSAAVAKRGWRIEGGLVRVIQDLLAPGKIQTGSWLGTRTLAMPATQGCEGSPTFIGDPVVKLATHEL